MANILRLSKGIGKLVKSFPRTEEYRLTSDILRAARSVPSNIAEGFGRFYYAEKIQFYNIAKGSTTETQNHIEESYNNGFITKEKMEFFLRKYHVVEVKLNNLIKSTLIAKKRSEEKRKNRKSGQ
jgi:four helix bundle protein